LKKEKVEMDAFWRWMHALVREGSNLSGTN
jgi:hypothetical protein